MCIKFRCANCGHNLKLEPQYAGKRVLCAGCHQPLVVPTSNGFRWAWFRKAKPISKEMDYSV
jgi:RNase P subunit RPR2